MIVYYCNDRVPIPEDTALCPACATAMTVGINAMEQHDDGTWHASEIEWTCESDPESIEDDTYESWRGLHDQLTYEEMLETEARILAYLTAHVRLVEHAR